MAAQNGHTEVLPPMLVQAKLDAHKASTDDGTPTAVAAALIGPADTLRVLVQAKVDMDKAEGQRRRHRPLPKGRVDAVRCSRRRRLSCTRPRLTTGHPPLSLRL